jgi:hypothetical protein
MQKMMSVNRKNFNVSLAASRYTGVSIPEKQIAGTVDVGTPSKFNKMKEKT